MLPKISGVYGCLYPLSKTVISALFFSFSVSASAADDSFNLYSLSLKELINMPITSATSKEQQTAVDAPGIVSRITRDDIELMGGNNLLDLLRRLPNVDVPSLYMFRNNMLSVRGQHADTTDTRVLILFDGRPMRETYNGGINAPIYEGFPLTSIEMIEVIRGPGSVLHGSGAFSAVINIITRKADVDQNHLNAQLSYGSFNTRMLDSSWSVFEEGLSITTGVKLLKSDGWDYAAYDANLIDNNDPLSAHDPVWGSMETAQSLHAFNITAKWQEWQLKYFESRNRTCSLGTEPLWDADMIDVKRRFVDLGYRHHYNDAWYSDINLGYNSLYTLTGGPVNENGTRDQMLEFTTFGQLSESLSMIIGGSRERLSWYRINIPEDKGTYYRNRFYAELAYTPIENMRLALGGQYNEAETLSNTSPRLSMTYRFHPEWGMKLLYGEAFREAVSIERFANIPGSFVGNPDLKPETIETRDAQLFYQGRDLFAALTAYQSREEDTVGLDFYAPQITYKNGGSIDYEGLEFEFKWQVNPSLGFEGSYSYQQNESVDGVDDIKLTPNRMVKLGMRYLCDTGVTLGLFNSYFSRYARRDTVVVENDDFTSYNHLSVQLQYDLNALLGLKAQFKHRLTLFGDNLLESEPQSAPDLARTDLSALPIRGGRAVYLRYEVKL